MELKLNIKMDNAAFGAYPNDEAARILKAIALEVQYGATDGSARDINGNAVGVWVIGHDDEGH